MNSPNGGGYSGRFRDLCVAQEYERFYQRGTADDAMWRIERRFLAELVERNREHWPSCRYLDFACGTGRVIQFVETLVASSQGIDIAPEMLEIAAQKVSRSELHCEDINSSGNHGDVYDLITAFRFFLNAEPELRQAVMQSLAKRLRNSQSLLVFTNHGNPWSYKALLWPYHRLRCWRTRRPVVGNYLTHGEIMRLLRRNGLRLVERQGYGLVSPKLFRLAPGLASAAEERWAFKPLVSNFGVNQIYVVAKADA